MKLALIALCFSSAAFAAPEPAKDIVMSNAENQPTIFEISRPALRHFYASVNTQSQSVKDEVSTTSAAPKAAAKK